MALSLRICYPDREIMTWTLPEATRRVRVPCSSATIVGWNVETQTGPPEHWSPFFEWAELLDENGLVLDRAITPPSGEFGFIELKADG